jgi:hypothetical protein
MAIELSGEWVQLPERGTLWPRVLLVMIGWAIGWIAYTSTMGVNWILRGVLLGGFGGFLTGLALRTRERRAGRVFLSTLLWAALWVGGALGMALSPSLLWSALVGGVVGMLGGVATARMLPGVSRRAVAWAWALAGVLAPLASMLLLGVIGFNYYDATGGVLVSSLLMGIVTGAIGGGITLRQIRRAGLL